MNEENTPVWAVIELMGHSRTGGLVSKDTQLGTAMLRVDVPQADGTTVTQLVNPSSIYRLTFCSEEIAKAAAAASCVRPVQAFEVRHLMPPEPAPVPARPHEDDDQF